MELFHDKRRNMTLSKRLLWILLVVSLDGIYWRETLPQ
jgi:hypothetical protein